MQSIEVKDEFVKVLRIMFQAKLNGLEVSLSRVERNPDRELKPDHRRKLETEHEALEEVVDQLLSLEKTLLEKGVQLL